MGTLYFMRKNPSPKRRSADWAWSCDQRVRSRDTRMSVRYWKMRNAQVPLRRYVFAMTTPTSTATNPSIINRRENDTTITSTYKEKEDERNKVFRSSKRRKMEGMNCRSWKDYNHTSPVKLEEIMVVHWVRDENQRTSRNSK